MAKIRSFFSENIHRRKMFFSIASIPVGRVLGSLGRRSVHVSEASLWSAQALDPVQKLFVEKIREYAEKQKNSGNRIVDPTPETEKETEIQMRYLNAKFGNVNYEMMSKFPEFNFTDPKLDPIDVQRPERKKM
ncbi:hypothetical protein AAG570_013347 [Ranatra chinensis]|uniref:ATP synthase-coupling factor 6, mitochondrial n=1 Tax=Ranatra chinensis TaxID=642074 RepID=A0ABD0YYB1_9HEMI